MNVILMVPATGVIPVIVTGSETMLRLLDPEVSPWLLAEAVWPLPEADDVELSLLVWPAAGAAANGALRISCNAPRLETPLVTPTIAEVPDLVSLPSANGLLTVGRTRTFCQVSLQVAPELAVLIVKTSCVEFTEVIAAPVPLVALLIFAIVLPPIVVTRSILTLGAVPPVSKTKPDG